MSRTELFCILSLAVIATACVQLLVRGTREYLAALEQRTLRYGLALLVLSVQLADAVNCMVTPGVLPVVIVWWIAGAALLVASRTARRKALGLSKEIHRALYEAGIRTDIADGILHGFYACGTGGSLRGEREEPYKTRNAYFRMFRDLSLPAENAALRSLQRKVRVPDLLTQYVVAVWIAWFLQPVTLVVVMGVRIP